jgi:hypothetical protein
MLQMMTADTALVDKFGMQKRQNLRADLMDNSYSYQLPRQHIAHYYMNSMYPTLQESIDHQDMIYKKKIPYKNKFLRDN